MLTRASRTPLHALSGAISAAASHIAITLLAALIPSTSSYASFVFLTCLRLPFNNIRSPLWA